MVGFSVRRPVTVAMAYLAVALLGIASWRHLPIELLPNAELPQLSVRAEWPGASPETTEAFLTAPLEAAVQQVRGVEKVISESSQNEGVGSAWLQVRFAHGTDMDFARLDLSERLAALEKELPDGARGPFVQQYVPAQLQDQQTPFLSYTVTGPYTLEALRKQIDDELTPALRQIEGVAAVVARGGRARILELALDEDRIHALGLSTEDVYSRVAELEHVSEAGTVSDGDLLRPLAIRQTIRDVAQILDTPLLTDKGRIVRVRDVGTVHDTYEQPSTYYRIDGEPAVSFEVVRAAGSNTVAVADRVKASLTQLAPHLPSGMRLILDNDESRAIRAQLTDLRSRAIGSAIVVFIVLLLFLRSFRSAAITFSTIGFSVLITINLIYFGGFTLNVLTLMGLAMGFGLIVDNAIVVLENIYRRARSGEAALAAEHGSREVVLPILAATLTNVVVLLPFVYLQGELRVYYVPLALVVAFSQAASILVGFTLIPAMAARLLRRRAAASELRSADGSPESESRHSPTRISRIDHLYRNTVRRCLRRPSPVIVGTILLFGASWFVFHKYVSRGVVWRPWFGQETYIAIDIEQPRGEELENTDAIARHFESQLRRTPGVERFTTRVTAQHADIRIGFPDSLQSTSLPIAVKERLVAEGAMFGGADVRVYGFGPSFYGGGAAPPNYSIKLLGYNYEMVRDLAEDIGHRMARFTRVREVNTNSSGRMFERDRATELVLQLDRPNLALHGLSAENVTRYVSAAVRGDSRRSAIRMGGEELQYSVKLAGYRDVDAVALMELQVPATNGAFVRLGDVAKIREREVQSRIVREDQQYQRVISYEFRGPTKLGDRVREAVVESTALPPGFSIAEEDGYRWSDNEQKQIYGVLLFAVLLIFMVCAALFESLRQPLCILLTVPMALIGVFVLFWITSASFTREAYVGVIMMSGIVVNSAILLVDRINQLRRHEQLGLEEAIVRGAAERARPILMTTVTTIAGLLPLVLFSEQADANIWNAMGYALIGGLLTSTVLVLLVMPGIYLVLEVKQGRKGRKGREGREGRKGSGASFS